METPTIYVRTRAQYTQFGRPFSKTTLQMRLCKVTFTTEEYFLDANLGLPAQSFGLLAFWQLGRFACFLVTFDLIKN